MKKLWALIILSIVLVPGLCFGLTATWTPSAGADGYYLYVARDGVENHYTIPGQVTEFDFELPAGVWAISMSAYNQAGESRERSNTVLYTQPAYEPKPSDPPELTSPPEPPGGFELIGQGFVMIWTGIKGLI